MSKHYKASRLKARIRKLFGDHIFDRDHVITFSKPLDRVDNFKTLNPKGITFYIATTENDIAPLITQFPERAKYFLEYISEGIECAFAVKNNEVSGYTFISIKDFYDRHLWKNTVHLNPREFFQFSGYVVPGSRGSITTLFILQQLHRHYKNKGFATAKTTISYRNEPSWRVCLKMGFDQIDQAWDVYKIFGFRWSRNVPVRIWVK